MATWVALSLVTLMIGGVIGFGFIARKVVIVWYHLLAIIIFTFMLSVATAFIGQYLTFLSVRFLEILVGLGLVGIAILLIRVKPSYPGSIDLLLLILALELDVSLLSFQYIQTHSAGYGLSFTISLLLLGSIVGGMVLAQKRWSNWRIVLLYPYIPSIIFFIIGLIKII